MNTLPRFDTQEVFNQSPPYEDIDLYSSDLPLQEAVRVNGAGDEASALTAFGRQWGTAEMFAAARRANENTPKLYTFDPKGFRRDVVEFHPAYHEFMRDEHRGRPACLDLDGDRHRAPRRPPRSRARRAITWRRRSRAGICARSP